MPSLKVTTLALFSMVAGTYAQCPINGAATNLIQGYEQFAAEPYDDGYGYWTVGYGHRCRPNNSDCQDVNWPLSEDAAQQLFQQDISGFESCLGNSLSYCLNGSQYGALVSWTYNIGCADMQSSALIRRLNNGEDPNTVAQEELPRWNKSNGQVSNGLVRRRNDEVQLFQQPDDGARNCC